jgi:endoglucanase
MLGTYAPLLVLVVVLALPSGASAQLPPGFYEHEVPIATRFCGQGGDPAAPGNGADPRGVSPSSRNPLSGLRFFTNPIGDPAYADMRKYERSGQGGKATLMARIAGQPRGSWFGKFTRPNFFEKVRNYLNCAQWLQPGTVPIMVVLRAQAQQCNPNYTAGGVAEDNATKRWYDDFARAVGDARVVIAFEPDSVGTIDCLKRSRRAARRKVLRYGVDALSKLPNATVYIEATASDWESVKTVSKTLKYLGVSKVRGFMLNVTHFDWTINNIRFGRKVSRKVGGKPFVVSTSYNGRGPVHFKKWINRSRHQWRRINVFCNPRFRGLGPTPTGDTGFAKVDGFLWLNRPGLSGAGTCNGAPPTGVWWPARALMYAKYATNWVTAPRGTAFGFRRHLSLCQLGAPLANGRYSTVAPEKRCRRR